MTRQVTYLTELASSADSFERMQWSVLLMLQMAKVGMLSAGQLDTQIQCDYALESPNTIPAGACEQFEVFMGENDAGIDEYAISAEQLTVQREGDLEATP